MEGGQGVSDPATCWDTIVQVCLKSWQLPSAAHPALLSYAEVGQIATTNMFHPHLMQHVSPVSSTACCDVMSAVYSRSTSPRVHHVFVFSYPCTELHIPRSDSPDYFLIALFPSHAPTCSIPCSSLFLCLPSSPFRFTVLSDLSHSTQRHL